MHRLLGGGDGDHGVQVAAEDPDADAAVDDGLEVRQHRPVGRVPELEQVVVAASVESLFKRVLSLLDRVSVWAVVATNETGRTYLHLVHE